jgi:hemerythrin-like domain-containing protein
MSKPLKRHSALIPLSQDHHFGLLLVWKIRKGIKDQIQTERIVNYFNYFTREHLEPHFQLEERLIFPVLAKNDLLRKEAEHQHQEIRSLIKQISLEKSLIYDQLSLFADKLEAHIRFEERKLFQHLQLELSDHDLENMNLSVQEIHQKVTEHWEDQFWNNN